MERLRRGVQRRTEPLAFGLSVIFAAGGAQAQATAGAARRSPSEDASPAEIVAARELFREGTEDADSGRFAEGLEKFKRVAAVKETPAVRFNIARCEEALGKTGGALADFELAEREGRQDPKAEDVAKLAHDRADALRPRVPRLGVVAPSPSPEGMAVSLDGGKLTTATLGAALPVDPGSHVIEATAPGRSPFRAEISLRAGEAQTVAVTLTPDANAPDLSPGELSASSQRTWGWVTIGAGGALAIGSGIFLLLHNSAISTLTTECPGNRCPASQQAQINGTESNARTDETVSVVFAAASAVAIGAGITLVLTAKSAQGAPAAAVTAGAPGAPAGLSLRGSF